MIVNDDASAIRLLQGLRQHKVIAVDTETTGEAGTATDSEGNDVDVEYSALILNRAHLVSFQICALNRPRLTFFVGKVGEHRCLTLSKILPALKELMEDPAVMKVFHNGNYDINVLRNYCIVVKNHYCTMLAGACQNENMENSLKARAVLVGMLLKKYKSIDKNNAGDFAEYGEDDITATEKLYQFYEGSATGGIVRVGGKLRIRAVAGTPQLTGMRRNFFEKQEMPFLNLIIGAERRGMLVDLKKVAAIDKQITEETTQHVRQIYRHAGGPFNIKSGKQLGEVLYNKLGITCPEDCVTDKGQPQTNARTLFYLKGQHPIVDELLEYKSKSKLQEVYTSPVSGLPHYCDSFGYVHATGNTCGAHTFRMSYSNPNLQTIPSKKDRYGLRSCFIAPDGYVMLVYDYSQIEVRIQAIYSRDPIMVDELNKAKGDIYLRTAREDGSPDPVAERQMYKVIVLALQYGMGPFTLADRMTQAGYPTTKTEARQKIDRYFRIYDGIPRLWDSLFSEHTRNGFCETLFGRPRHIEGFDQTYHYGGKRSGLNEFERALVNNSMQGSTADFVKQSMLRTWRKQQIWLMGYRMGLQVHDEVLGVVPEREAEEALDIVTRTAVLVPAAPFHPRREMCVKIKLEAGLGPNWAIAKKGAK